MSLPLQDAPPRRKTLVWIIASLALLGMGVGYYWQSAKPVPNPAKGKSYKEVETPVAVAVASATQADFDVYLQGLGTVTALRSVLVKPRVDGELVRVVFTEGQYVQAGELLAEIDPRPFQIQLQQAEGQLMRDQALLKNAQLDQSRYQTLLAQDAIAAQQAASQAAQAKQYQGIVAMDQAQVNSAKLQLSYTKLTAPIAGQVGLRQIDQGNIVHANDSLGLVVISQLQPISVVFTLPEDQVQPVLQRLRKHQDIRIEAYDRAGKTLLAQGQLAAIDNQIDPATGTLKLKAQFANTDLSLFANQFVNIKMHLDTLPNAIHIATAAIQHDAAGAFVYVVQADKIVAQRRVDLGPTEGDKVVVKDNLAVGELAIIAGADRVTVGKAVDIAEQDGKPIAAAQASKPTRR